METIATAAVGVIALQHFLFMTLEMFLWDKPAGMRIFGLKPEFARATKALAANQGLYNGFLAAGLLWSLVPGPGSFPVKMFFLGCVIIAGVFGGFTANRAIFFVQALPAAVAMALVIAS